MLIDIFTYTQASPNAPLSIESIIEAAKAAGLDGIAVTDRRASSMARDYCDIARRENFFLVHGIELETAQGRVVAFPEQINDEYLAEGWRCLGEAPEVEDVLEYFHERGGIVVARDVFNRSEGLKDRVYNARDSKGRSFDAIDTIAAYRRRIDNELAIEAQQVLGIPACAGSGAFDNPDDVGYCATLFANPIHDQASFVAAMRNPLHWSCALKNLNDACPMGSEPVTEEHPHRRDRDFDSRDSRRKPDRREHRQNGERRHCARSDNDQNRNESRSSNDRRNSHSRGFGRKQDSRNADNRGRRR